MRGARVQQRDESHAVDRHQQQHGLLPDACERMEGDNMEGDDEGFGLDRPLGSGVGLELRCDIIHVRVVDNLQAE
jgi:hypothetical protein